MRSWKQQFVFFIILLIITIEAPILAVGYFAKPEPGDAIIVLGAKLIGSEPSTMLRLRLDEAIRLYRQNYAPAIIVSGAQGHDEATSEAQAMHHYLIKHGIPDSAILLEDQSFNTQQNLANSKKLMLQHGLEKAIIVSNASHIRRSLLIANKMSIQASASPAPMADNTYLLLKQYVREGAAVFLLLATTGRLPDVNSTVP